MTAIWMIGRSLTALGVACVFLAGCSDGIDVHSKLLDNIGSTVIGSHQEPQLAERQNLVIPPKMAALPQPGAGSQVAADVNAQLPQNPELTGTAIAEAKKKKDAEACRIASQNRKDPQLQAACPGLIGKLFTPATDETPQ